MSVVRTSSSELSSTDLFEKILKKKELPFYELKEITISEKDYIDVINNPGNFSRVNFFDYGESKWCFYHAIDGRKVFVIETSTLGGKIWTWRFKKSGELVVLKARKRKFGEISKFIKIEQKSLLV